MTRKQSVYNIRISFDPDKYEREMRGLFYIGRISQILKHYTEENGNWFIDANSEDGLQIDWCVVDSVTEYEAYNEGND